MCVQCYVEAVIYKADQYAGQSVRVVELYHEGFTVPFIADVLGIDPLLTAYIIEDYA